MWQRNSIGPKGTVPWGTPTVVSFDFSPSTIVQACEKSNIATSNWCPLWCSCRKSFIVVRSCVSQE
jgi:hypothetical protein